ncbi:MAG: TRAP transporter small permease [Pseudomonadota bacterium]
MRFLRLLDRGLTRLVTAVLVTAFALMLFLAALQVFLRFFFHGGIAWGDIAARHLVLWVGFCGAYIATRENRHFRIDALIRTLPPRLHPWLDAVVDLFSAGICCFLVRASLSFVNVAVDPASVLFLGIPERFVAWIVPVGFALVAFQFLIRLVENILKALRGGESAR